MYYFHLPHDVRELTGHSNRTDINGSFIFMLTMEEEQCVSGGGVPRGKHSQHSHLGEELLDVRARADLLGECVEDVEGEHIRLDLVILQRKAHHPTAV